jgi:heptaprenyl diphosphate synthase component I
LLKEGNIKPKIKYMSMYAMFVALAMILSYIESLIPIPFAVPGMKIGLANLVVIVALYVMDEKAAISISLIRVILVSFTFANLSAMIFSLAGALCSIICMLLLKRTGNYSVSGVSIVGAVSHNVGQLMVAMAVVNTVQVISYLPILIIFGVTSGFLMGMLAIMVINRIKKAIK